MLSKSRLLPGLAWRWRYLISTIRFFGNRRYCPVCERKSSHFVKFGLMSRKDAQCFHCWALERHRLLWLFLHEKTNLFDATPKDILHIAPEPCFESRLKERFHGSYLTGDLHNPRAMIKMDVCDIPYSDATFDVIFCNHVLEHVEDDRLAMREFWRVLRSGGWAILNVPISVKKTFEDPTVVGPKERLAVFGQEDHVRCYGPDYVNRLYDAGFDVDVVTVQDLVDHKDSMKMGLTSASGEIYYCKKRE